MRRSPTRLTVPVTDDPSLPVWTSRMWTMGFLSCALLSFLNQFFAYRSEPIVISQISIQVTALLYLLSTTPWTPMLIGGIHGSLMHAWIWIWMQVVALPIGHFLAWVLLEKKFRVFGRECSLNPGPFNVKEHVLISIFANAGASFGGGNAYAIGIVTIIKAFYKRNISFVTSLLLVITTQVLGYGWAGLMRKYVVEPAHMWWPVSLVQVSLMRYGDSREGEAADDAGQVLLDRAHLQLRVVHGAGVLFPTLTAVSWVCWVFPNSITMQQIGSGLNGLDIGAFTLDWSTVVSWLGSPLVTPFFATANVLVGYVLLVYIMLPVAYWVLNLYSASRYPMFSNELFDASGQLYNIHNIVNDKFEIDMDAYAKQGRIHLSLFFAVSYGLGFATIAATLSHVTFFYGKEMYQRFRESYKGKMDVHARLMKRYDDIPNWWFYILLEASMTVSMVLFTVFKEEVQLPWWASSWPAPWPSSSRSPSTPGLNIITEYCWGLIMPGKPIGNVCFK
ncbi:hypothetical protein ZWY2020_024578 [Hordeum vulgare]|nr:hypothetical protein ZWY2020_024578 [Hordeum vulgare]